MPPTWCPSPTSSSARRAQPSVGWVRPASLLHTCCLFVHGFVVFWSGMHARRWRAQQAPALASTLLIQTRLPFAPRQFSFAVMSGPLMWSIVAMRNSVRPGRGATLRLPPRRAASAG